MSSNKSIREKMIEKYGKICMMEEAGIRCIPVEERKKIKGYKKIDEKITYHHLRAKCKGGEATEENGALLKGYNHQWLEGQPKEVREQINNELRAYKVRFNGMIITGNMKVCRQMSFDIEGIKPGECYVIPAYDNVPKKEEKER